MFLFLLGILEKPNKRMLTTNYGDNVECMMIMVKKTILDPNQLVTFLREHSFAPSKHVWDAQAFV